MARTRRHDTGHSGARADNRSRSLTDGQAVGALAVPVGHYQQPHAKVWIDARVEQWKQDGERPAVAVWTAEQLTTFLGTFFLSKTASSVINSEANCRPVRPTMSRGRTVFSRERACGADRHSFAPPDTSSSRGVQAADALGAGLAQGRPPRRART
ncbi:hypothetical protein ABGB16_22185 [Micromonospora sp. B11E3]|uniref:hypothetical protein n=1 Tax=Micromonospora sp. B11E3 TaxID=3153562 RepID=UPI00325DBF7C